jgi:hypothetical protein
MSGPTVGTVGQEERSDQAVTRPKSGAMRYMRDEFPRRRVQERGSSLLHCSNRVSIDDGQSSFITIVINERGEW